MVAGALLVGLGRVLGDEGLAGAGNLREIGVKLLARVVLLPLCELGVGHAVGATAGVRHCGSGVVEAVLRCM